MLQHWHNFLHTIPTILPATGLAKESARVKGTGTAMWLSE